MGDLFFLFKSFVMTVFVVILLQVKVGKNTLEQYSYQWITQSEVGGYINEVAQGLVVFVSKSAKEVRGTMNDKFTELMDRENSPGSRALKFQMERSEEYLKEKLKGDDSE